MLATVTVERNTRALFYDETKTVCQCMLYAELCLPAKFNESIGAANKDWMMLGVCFKSQSDTTKAPGPETLMQ